MACSLLRLLFDTLSTRSAGGSPAGPSPPDPDEELLDALEEELLAERRAVVREVRRRTWLWMLAVTLSTSASAISAVRPRSVTKASRMHSCTKLRSKRSRGNAAATSPVICARVCANCVALALEAALLMTASRT